MTFKATAEVPLKGPQKTDSAADRQRVADFLHGEPEAVEQVSLWIRQAAARYRTQLPAEWDDLLQDLLLEVTAVFRDEGFRGESSLRTFVSRIAHYRCLNRLRDRARRPEHELDERHLKLTDPAQPADDRMLEREREDLLLQILRSVSEDCHRLWRAILAGRSYREMSRETGVSEGALRVRVRRCRQKALAQWRDWQDSSKR